MLSLPNLHRYLEWKINKSKQKTVLNLRLSLALVVYINHSCFYLIIHILQYLNNFNLNTIKTLHSTNLFYFLGSKCEKWHKEGKSLRNFPRTRKATGPLFNDIPDDDQSLQDQSKVNMNKLDKCGVQPVTGPFSNGAGSWAARIMGMYCFLSFMNSICLSIPNLSFRTCRSEPAILNLSF